MRLFPIIILIALLPMAQADVHLAGNYTGNGTISSYSEGPSHKLSASAVGPSELFLQVDLPDSLTSSAFQGLQAEKDASFVARTPEYTLRVRDAKDFRGTVDLSRESTIEETEEIITEANGSLKQITETTFTDTAVATFIQGSSGRFSEDIDVSYAGKARALKLRELDGSGNFSLATDLTLSGALVKRDFGILNETEAFDKTIIATDAETGSGALEGV
jgi:hypothetical protein